MRTKNIATVSAVVFGLTAGLLGGTALSQATQTNDQQGQTGTQTDGQMGTQALDQTGTQTNDQLLQQDQAGSQTQDQLGTQTDGQTGTQAQDQTGTQTNDQLLQQDQAAGQAQDQMSTQTNDQMGTQTGGQTGTQAQGQTGTQPDGASTTAETGVAGDTSLSSGSGMAANDGLPRRSVSDSATPYTADVLAGITADELIGMNVVDANGDSVGSVTDLLFGADDQVDHAIVDVGGFLGFGAKSVAIPMDQLTIAEGDGEVVLNMTREQLDGMSQWTRGNDGWMSN